ncbi:hypothetical protein QTO34_015055 [Cnephaeus nilssonii]|uniref:Uncharacterized protein n=1 Tax=Cnephaeus nilssonii TaxID=3371016 RepID=A0AA40LSR3_CNENI|nr:hypothetical protein QTO34_015055 [Eptesicus nilssonii]
MHSSFGNPNIRDTQTCEEFLETARPGRTCVGRWTFAAGVSAFPAGPLEESGLEAAVRPGGSRASLLRSAAGGGAAPGARRVQPSGDSAHPRGEEPSKGTWLLSRGEQALRCQ